MPSLQPIPLPPDPNLPYYKQLSSTGDMIQESARNTQALFSSVLENRKKQQMMQASAEKDQQQKLDSTVDGWMSRLDSFKSDPDRYTAYYNALITHPGANQAINKSLAPYGGLNFFQQTQNPDVVVGTPQDMIRKKKRDVAVDLAVEQSDVGQAQRQQELRTKAQDTNLEADLRRKNSLGFAYDSKTGYISNEMRRGDIKDDYYVMDEKERDQMYKLQENLNLLQRASLIWDQQQRGMTPEEKKNSKGFDMTTMFGDSSKLGGKYPADVFGQAIDGWLNFGPAEVRQKRAIVNEGFRQYMAGELDPESSKKLLAALKEDKTQPIYGLTRQDDKGREAQVYGPSPLYYLAAMTEGRNPQEFLAKLKQEEEAKKNKLNPQNKASLFQVFQNATEATGFQKKLEDTGSSLLQSLYPDQEEVD